MALCTSAGISFISSLPLFLVLLDIPCTIPYLGGGGGQFMFGEIHVRTGCALALLNTIL